MKYFDPILGFCRRIFSSLKRLLPTRFQPDHLGQPLISTDESFWTDMQPHLRSLTTSCSSFAVQGNSDIWGSDEEFWNWINQNPPPMPHRLNAPVASTQNLDSASNLIGQDPNLAQPCRNGMVDQPRTLNEIVMPCLCYPNNTVPTRNTYPSNHIHQQGFLNRPNREVISHLESNRTLNTNLRSQSRHRAQELRETVYPRANARVNLLQSSSNHQTELPRFLRQRRKIRKTRHFNLRDFLFQPNSQSSSTSGASISPVQFRFEPRLPPRRQMKIFRKIKAETISQSQIQWRKNQLIQNAIGSQIASNNTGKSQTSQNGQFVASQLSTNIDSLPRRQSHWKDINQNPQPLPIIRDELDFELSSIIQECSYEQQQENPRLCFTQRRVRDALQAQLPIGQELPPPPSYQSESESSETLQDQYGLLSDFLDKSPVDRKEPNKDQNS